MLDEKRDKVRLLLRDYYTGSIGDNDAADLGAMLQDGQYDALVQEVLAEISAEVEPMELDPSDMDRMMTRLQDTKAPAPCARFTGAGSPPPP